MDLKITPSDQTIVKPTALGPVANTDTKLLIYGLFQKGRVFGTGRGSRIGKIERKADDVFNELRVLIQRRAYRMIELRRETVIPAKEMLGLPSHLRPVCASAVAFDTSVGAPAFSTEFFFLGCWFQRGELATHFLKAVVAASVNRANILKTDVWKAHSGDVPAGVGSVSTSHFGRSGRFVWQFLSDRGDILPDFLLARRQHFVQQCVK